MELFDAKNLDISAFKTIFDSYFSKVSRVWNWRNIIWWIGDLHWVIYENQVSIWIEISGFLTVLANIDEKMGIIMVFPIIPFHLPTWIRLAYLKSKKQTLFSTFNLFHNTKLAYDGNSQMETERQKPPSMQKLLKKHRFYKSDQNPHGHIRY